MSNSQLQVGDQFGCVVDTSDDHTKPGQIERQESRILDRQLSSLTEDKLDNKAGTTLIEEEMAKTGRVSHFTSVLPRTHIQCCFVLY